MGLFLGILAISTAVLLSFSDKIIEHFAPDGELAKMSDEVDEVMVMIEDQDDLHDGK